MLALPHVIDAATIMEIPHYLQLIFNQVHCTIDRLCELVGYVHSGYDFEWHLKWGPFDKSINSCKDS